MSQYKAAVIGLGNIGFQFDMDSKRKGTWSHVAAYEKCNQTKLVAAVELCDEKISVFKRQYENVPVFKSIKEMMKTLPVDIASVCTPTESHYSILKELIEYPIKGIFCEKPLAAGVNEAKEAVSMCNKNKVVFAVNHTRRWDSNYLLSKQMVHSGKIGQVTAVSAYYPTAVFSAGTHLFDTVRMIIEKNPEIVSGISLDSNNRDPGVSGWIQYKENIICGVTSTGKREDLIFELDIIGEEGRLRILENGEKIELSSFDSSARYTGYRELTPVSIKTIPQKDRFIEAVKDIVAVIEGKKDAVNCSGEDGFLSLATSVAMVESAQRKGVPRTVENMA